MAKTKKLRSSKAKEKVEIPRLSVPGVDDVNEPPARLTDYCITVFGEKGIGKTSLASRFEGMVVAMSEPRRRNLRIRMQSIAAKSIKEMVREERKTGSVVDPWVQFKMFVEDVIADPTAHGLTTDTLDRIYEMCFNSHCYNEGISDPSERNDFGAGWRQIADDFESTLNQILYAEKSLLMISHAHLREVETRDGTEGYDLLIPTCSKAAFKYIKAASDFAFYYGYYQKRRALYLRGTDHIWCACGVDNHFLSRKGEPLGIISMGRSAQEGYENLLAAYENALPDSQIFRLADMEDEEEDEAPRKPKKRKTA